MVGHGAFACTYSRSRLFRRKRFRWSESQWTVIYFLVQATISNIEAAIRLPGVLRAHRLFLFCGIKITIPCAFAFMSLTGPAFSSVQRKARDFVTLVATAIRYAGWPFSVRFRTLYDFIQSLTYYMPFHQFKHI